MSGILLAAVSSTVAADEQRQGSKSDESGASQVRESELRGSIVCLAEEMHRLHAANLPTSHEHIYGFKTEDRKYYTLLRTKYSEALFADKRLQEKKLLLKGRLFPNAQVFEPITIRSVRNGVVHELYYHCVICEIFSVAPGICECCQGPTELVEKPLK